MPSSQSILLSTQKLQSASKPAFADSTSLASQSARDFGIPVPSHPRSPPPPTPQTSLPDASSDAQTAPAGPLLPLSNPPPPGPGPPLPVPTSAPATAPPPSHLPPAVPPAPPPSHPLPPQPPKHPPPP